jgi:hypothetical protein
VSKSSARGEKKEKVFHKGIKGEILVQKLETTLITDPKLRQELVLESIEVTC